MTFSCKKYAIKLSIIFSIIPVVDIIQYHNPINIKFNLSIILISIIGIVRACNNYRLEITDEQLILYRLIGKNKRIKLNEINKIEVENLSFMEMKPIGVYGTKHVRLFVYTDAKIYELKLRALDTRLISEYLEKMAPIWGIPFKNKMEDIL